MSRTIFPTTPDAVRELIDAVMLRNKDLGADSPLPPLLTQKGIDLGADLSAAKQAKDHELAAGVLRSASENYVALRKLKTEPAMKSVSGIGQVLKSFYKPTFTEVALWGIDITGTGKISYPADVNQQQVLVKSIITQNATYPAGGSPLAAYLAKEGIDLATLDTALAEAVDYENQATKKRKAAESETEQRDQKLAPVTEHLRTIGGYLMDFYKSNPRELGLWGFLVEESTSKPTEKTSKIKLLDQITLNAVIIGGTLTNVGEVDVHVYKGKTTKGNPIILKPADVFGVPKGFSTLTVSNPSPLKTAIIKTLVSK